jgi:hypothetical protein
MSIAEKAGAVGWFRGAGDAKVEVASIVLPRVAVTFGLGQPGSESGGPSVSPGFSYPVAGAKGSHRWCATGRERRAVRTGASGGGHSAGEARLRAGIGLCQTALPGGNARRQSVANGRWRARSVVEGRSHAILMRRTLTRTSAPILNSLRRMVPQVAWANWVGRSAIRRKLRSST